MSDDENEDEKEPIKPPKSESPAGALHAPAALESPDELKTLFSSTGAGSAEGIAVRLKGLTTALLATDGFFRRKDDSLQRALDSNASDQERLNAKVTRIEAQLNRKYSALDTQIASLNSLNNYLMQQISQWNKTNS